MTIAKSDDLVFGEQQRVVVIQGLRDFTSLSSAGDPVQWYAAGSLADGPIADLTLESDFGGQFGNFIILIHEIDHQRLTILNDRYGLLPFFVKRGSDQIVFSRQLTSLACRQHVERVDYHGLSDMLAFDVPLGDRTPYEGIKILPAASKLVINLESLSLQENRTWQSSSLLNEADIPLRSVQKELTQLLLEGFERATADCQDLGITLSGGVDSRVLLAIGSHLGKTMHPYSTGVPGSRSLVYAERMAEICGTRCQLFPLDKEFLSEYRNIVADNIRLTEGMSFSSEAEGHWLRNHVSSHDMMVHGGFAELYKIGMMHSYYIDSRSTNFDQAQFTEMIWQRFANRYDKRKETLSNGAKSRLDHHARDSLYRRIERYPTANGAPCWSQQLYLDEFLGKVTVSSARIWRHRMPICFPFSYPPFVDLLLRVRPRDKWNLAFPYRMLKKINPQLAAFPDSNTGTRIGTPKFVVKGVRVLDKIRNRLFADRVGYDHTDAVAWAGALSPSANELLPQLLGAALGPQHQVDALCESAMISGDTFAADSVLLLLTLGSWLDRQSETLRADFGVI